MRNLLTARLGALLFFCMLGYSALAQVVSPAAYLGYPVGSRYTPHWKIAGYFYQLAAGAPSQIRLESYGQTNEGRPLLLVMVSSPDNIRNLDTIRMNNLRLAGMAPEKTHGTGSVAPAIVWLSYNVHGNEASSSEAAMSVAYELVRPGGRAAEWLRNTVVIIDPCLNPDGRDRYINWFNSVVGKSYNVQRLAREHREPWPGGRTNHYNFDLNRDWAWQTQVESRQRLRVYNQWMPQVHVDFHEQGINEPYYFAPAAEPLHEVITPFQKEFQATIGRNHARYFDANGWLYFTRTRFDLFYPSYGDTWPMYNGAIGMTYEQGGIGAGLGVINDEGDTLRLTDRVNHHVTTSLSTIETAAAHAEKLVSEFGRYFTEARQQGVGIYKSYVVKSEEGNRDRMEKLARLLEQNGIRFGAGTGASVKGYNYFSRAEETTTALPADMVIPALQPKSVLLKVLFEPESRLSDSVTYDITAWSVPYAYGLKTYGVKEKLAPSANWSAGPEIKNAGTSYGYALPWTGLRSARLAARLLQQGILLRYAEEPFETGGRSFSRGSVLVLKTANTQWGEQLWSVVKEAADREQVQLYPVTSGMVEKGNDFGSDKVHPFRAPRVVLLTGETVNSNAAGEIWHFFEQDLDYAVTLVNVSDAGRINWNETDVLILPDGSYRFLNNKDEFEPIRSWINKGGRVIALEGAVAQLARADLGITAKKSDEKTDRNNDADDLPVYEQRERDAVSGGTPGSVWKVKLDNTHPLAFGYPAYYYTLKQDDALYEFMGDGGWNVGVIGDEKAVSGFVGGQLQRRLKNGMLFGVKKMGNGSITLLADNPLFRSFWENGKLMFCNALFFDGK